MDCLECPCSAGLVPAGLVPAGLVPAGLPAWCLPACQLLGIERCAVQHGGRVGLELAVLVRVAPTNNFFLLGHQRKPLAYSHRIGQIGTLDTAFAAVV